MDKRRPRGSNELHWRRMREGSRPMRVTFLGLATAAIGCSLFLDDPAVEGSPLPDASFDTGDEDSPPLEDARSDGGCDPLGPLVRISEIPFATASTAYKDLPRLSDDELTIYFSTCVFFACQIRFATRGARDLPFAAPANLHAPVNASQVNRFPWLTSDGLSLYFSSNRTNDAGTNDIVTATRGSVLEGFSNVVVLGPPIATNLHESMGSIDRAGTIYYSRSNGFGVPTLRTATFSSSSGYAEGSSLSELGASLADDHPLISPDGRILYFTSRRPLADAGDSGPPKKGRPYRAIRTDPSKPFDPPTPVSDFVEDDIPSWVSPDSCRVYFSSSSRASPDAGPDAGVPYLWVGERAL